MESLTETIICKLEQTGIPKEERKTNTQRRAENQTDKVQRTGPYQASSNTHLVIVKFKSHTL